MSDRGGLRPGAESPAGEPRKVEALVGWGPHHDRRKATRLRAAAPVATAALAGEEATMEEHFVWMTTRRIKPGTLTGFERAWRPDIHPEGMLRLRVLVRGRAGDRRGLVLGLKGVLRSLASLRRGGAPA
jgi:hypothetical protein